MTLEEWVEEHTVDGIRPHLPRSAEEDDRQRKLAEQEMARTDWPGSSPRSRRAE